MSIRVSDLKDSLRPATLAPMIAASRRSMGNQASRAHFPVVCGSDCPVGFIGISPQDVIFPVLRTEKGNIILDITD
jgi:hypothetical protein